MHYSICTRNWGFLSSGQLIIPFQMYEKNIFFGNDIRSSLYSKKPHFTVIVCNTFFNEKRLFDSLITCSISVTTVEFQTLWLKECFVSSRKWSMETYHLGYFGSAVTFIVTLFFRQPEFSTNMVKHGTVWGQHQCQVMPRWYTCL